MTLFIFEHFAAPRGSEGGAEYRVRERLGLGRKVALRAWPSAWWLPKAAACPLAARRVRAFRVAREALRLRGARITAFSCRLAHRIQGLGGALPRAARRVGGFDGGQEQEAGRGQPPPPHRGGAAGRTL